MTGIEPVTSSLPRKRSTPELHRQKIERETEFESATLSLEGWCSTNWATPAYFSNIGHVQQPSAKVPALKPLFSGESRIRTYEVIRQQIYSLPQLATLVSPQVNTDAFVRYTFVSFPKSRWRDSNPRPADYKSAALTSWATSAFLKNAY